MCIYFDAAIAKSCSEDDAEEVKEMDPDENGSQETEVVSDCFCFAPHTPMTKVAGNTPQTNNSVCMSS